MKHLIIIPVYNEEVNLKRLILSLVNQTIHPDLLIFVDDNSTDSSKEIIQSFTKQFDWIKYVYKASEIGKSQGKKIIEAFNFGLNQIEDINDFEIISKFDADLEFPIVYCDQVIQTFKRDLKNGVVGGRICEQKKGFWEIIPQASYHIRGALKSYRTSCFNEFGGLKPVMGWDGIDELSAMYFGWKTEIINISVKHFRPANNDYNLIVLNKKIGEAYYQNGSNILLALIRAIFKLRHRPFLLVSISFLSGYFNALFSGKNKNVSKEISRFINHFHLKRIMNFKF